MDRFNFAPAILLFAALAAPTAVAQEVSLPLHKAWYEGRVIHYVTTDISDLAMARAAGVNHVPRLADALPEEPVRPGRRSLVERVYKFVDGEQDSVFPSVPRPVGAANVDAGYSPLWQLVAVRWRPGSAPRLLDSEEAILAAEERGQVRLEITRIVVNCPVVREVGGAALGGVR